MKNITGFVKNFIRVVILFICVVIFCGIMTACHAGRYECEDSVFTYSNAHISENPMRGIAVWTTSKELEFPFSLEYVPLPLSALYKDGEANFEYLEERLNRVAERGNNAITRLLLWENESSYLPEHYKAGGVTEVDVNGVSVPNFSSIKLIEYLTEFITHFGNRYDGDERIGFIQLGLMGRWGEWNYGDNYPQDKIPTGDEYNAIYKAYDDAFNITKLMARNPNLGTPRDYNIGYHDDNFVFSTLGSGGGDFKYLYEKGQEAADKYKRECFGAELSGNLNGDFFSTLAKREQFISSVNYANFSWMMWQRYESVNHSKENQALYMPLINQMGYEYTITEYKTTLNGDTLRGEIVIKNSGSAPFYYDWDFALRILGEGGTAALEKVFDINLSSIMPNEQKTLSLELDISSLSGENYTLIGGIVNPLSASFNNAKPLYFANECQYDNGFVVLSNLSKR